MKRSLNNFTNTTTQKSTKTKRIKDIAKNEIPDFTGDSAKIYADVNKVLDAIQESVPKQDRPNIGVKEDVHGFVLGTVDSRAGTNQLSNQTQARPNLVISLNRFMAWHLEQTGDKDFEWTTIQLNLNTQCDVHVDANNMGPSKIIGLGDYRGGDLWVKDLGAVDIKDRFLEFDGRKAHATMPFQVVGMHGNRFSLVYFVDSRFIRMETSALIKNSMERDYEYSRLPTLSLPAYEALPNSKKPFMPNSNEAKERVEAGKLDFARCLRSAVGERPLQRKRIELVGLQKRPDLNGSHGLAEEWDKV